MSVLTEAPPVVMVLGRAYRQALTFAQDRLHPGLGHALAPDHRRITERLRGTNGPVLVLLLGARAAMPRDRLAELVALVRARRGHVIEHDQLCQHVPACHRAWPDYCWPADYVAIVSQSMREHGYAPDLTGAYTGSRPGLIARVAEHRRSER